MLEVRLRKAFRGFSLDVAFSCGDSVLAFLGPSGAGKTMTLRCIAGLVRPDEGLIKLNGRVLLDTLSGVALPARVRHVGFAFQHYALFPHMTAGDNVAFGIKHLGKAEARRRVSDLFDLMRMSDLQGRYPGQLSAGQQQRVSLARALAPDPEVLLLDEPFSALDSLVRERLQLEIRALRAIYKGTVIFVTHDLAEAYNVSSRISIFEAGRIVQDDHIRHVVHHPATESVARLVGIRNIMKGSVVGVAERGVIVRTPDLDVDVTAVAEDAINVRGSVSIGIRPEHVRLEDDAGENTFLATVDSVTEGVTRWHCQYHVNSTGAIGQFAVASPAGSAGVGFERGGQVWLRFPPEHIVVISG